MTKIRIPFVFAAALVLLVLVVIARAPSVPSASARPVQLATPTFVTSRVTGVPAIKASLPGHIPAFTEGDVRSYVHAHHFAQGIDDSKITSIRFIPSSQATALMKGEQTGIGDNEMVCYVEFANINATLDNVPRPYGALAPVVHTGQIVYDASDGNLLVWGGL